ncbi:MAG TPA: isoprenylcysteine carboxylmethyltransferase family protein [Blastocatellia bacterium]|jgi:protein-S-isoprenylcysteine O-methyltransferase Ste14|nr:isoprenylcysteine carboxylmethyltransferase family protein [Blastocatellia bacterium]
MNKHERVTDYSLRFLVQRLRVPIGFITAILFVIFSRPTWRSLAVGVPIAFCGATVRAWASGHLWKNSELAVSGPYAFTRNPLYFGSFVMASGCAVCGGSLWLSLWLMALFLAVYLPVMQAEAAHMQRLFAGDYEKWASNVPLFIPRVTPYRNGRTQRFDPRQYLRHREYRAAIGLVIVICALSFKAARIFFF